MKKFLLAVLFFSSFATQAEPLGLTVGAYIWNAEVTEGFMNISDYPVPGDTYNILLDARDANNDVIYIDWRHDFTRLPNLKASINNIYHTGTGVIDISGTLYPIEGVADMTHYDLIVYWPVLNSDLSLDLGLTVRLLDGLTGDKVFGIEIPLSMTMPLLYSRVNYALPLGFDIGMDLMLGSYDGDTATDANFYASYISHFGLGINAGYRILETDIETTVKGFPQAKVDASMDFKGAYMGLFYSF